jgi:hypothetical protein
MRVTKIAILIDQSQKFEGTRGLRGLLMDFYRCAKTRRQTCGFAGAEVEGGMKLCHLKRVAQNQSSLELNCTDFFARLCTASNKWNISQKGP